MKKLKTFFGVFAVALLLMSMTSNSAITKEELKKNTCQELASILANNWCCDWFGEDYSSNTYFLVYSALSNSMGC